MTETATTIHALLIGIDYYQPNRLYRSLRGAVRDIHLVDTFLRNTLQLPPDRIRKLLSPNPDDPVFSGLTVAPDDLPTYANIVNAFAQLTHTAQPGEQVYIHYCGHGGRVITAFNRLKHGIYEQYDEGLAPFDIGDTPDGRYLRDVEMTTLLKRMTDKGLIVTVVLDCCHSGGIPRENADIRGGLTPDTTERSLESLVASQAELEKNSLMVTRERAIAVQLPHVQDYVLLAACRPGEYAFEYAVNGGVERYGALTYWMIDTLSSIATRKQPLTYRLLHDRINAQIQSKFQHQTPMILGESDRLVFGTTRWSTPYTVSVIKVDASATQVKLNAGLAQGLSRGTRFSIYPLNTADFSDTQQQVAIVELTQVNASDSMATVLSPEDGGIVLNGHLEPGAPAILVSVPLDLIRRVRFVTDKPEGAQEHELPASLVRCQGEALEAVRQAMTGNGWLVEVEAGESAHYQVAVGRAGEYEISIGTPIQNLRPVLAIDDPTAAKQVVDRLIHLAKYQSVLSLDNVQSKLNQSIQMVVLREDGTALDDPQNPVIQDGEIITLRLTNQSQQALKVAVLDIEPTWSISQIPLGGVDSPFFNLDAGAREELLLQMSLPDDAEYSQARETFKVFAIQRGLADFRWLTLPPLDQPYAPRAATLETALHDHIKRSGEEINPLHHLLAAIGADLENAPTFTRAATVVVDPKQEWATQQIQLLIERS